MSNFFHKLFWLFILDMKFLLDYRFVFESVPVCSAIIQSKSGVLYGI